MRKSPVTCCEVIVSDDRKTVLYCLRLDSGHAVQKKFEEYEKFYMRISYLLPASHSLPPKKRLLQGENKLIEKRKSWILSVSQTLLIHHNDCPSEDIREFYCLPTEDENEFLPKEMKKAVPGHFEVLKTIGKGSFGRVFQVRHKETKKIYAMKVLMKETIKKKNETKHVMAELAVLKMNINHPFLVSLHFSFQTKEKLYFILDNLNGGELFSHLQKEKHFNEARSRFYAADIACALGYLHDNNIIYRDLKPENLLLDREGYIVLTDFGLCKEGMKAGVTTSTFCGTPEYLAPEIVLKKPYERSVDWWCLGAVLYEMLFGLPPFYSRDHQEMYDRIVNQPLRFKSQISAAATDMINGLLSKDPKKRLGARNDFIDIKNHPFFMPIDFDRLLGRQLKAPYIPKIANEYDTSLVAPCFTDERFDPASLVPDHAMASSVHDPFDGFTYVSKPVIR